MSTAQDATIRDRLSSINKPEDFLIRVMKRMKQLDAHENGEVVRIGLQGKDTHPNFRIGKAGLAQPEDKAFDYNGVLFTTRLQPHTWSSEGMTYPDVQALLGDFRAKRI